MPVPPRTFICLHCRSALLEGERCDIDPTHATANMREIYGRECLIAAVWGPPRSRYEQLQTRQRTSQALGGLAAFGTAAGMLASTMFFPFATVATAALGGAISGSAFWILGKRAVGNAEHPYPIGAEPVPRAREERAEQRGRVLGGELLISPASVSECVGYALELHYEGPFGHRVMYRDAVCTDFELELDDSQLVRIPAGRMRLFGPVQQEVDFDNLQVEEHLCAFDHKRAPDSKFDPLRYNIVYEQVLIPGDRIRLASQLEPTLDPQALPGHYRQSMSTYLAPVGVPVMTLETGARRSRRPRERRASSDPHH